MQTADFIIAGQGIAGSLLAIELSLRGMQIIITDDKRRHAASLAAGAVLNPYKPRGTPGKDHWHQHQEALAYYKHLQAMLAVNFIRETPLLLFGREGQELIRPFTMTCKEPLRDVYTISPASLISAVKDYLEQRHAYVSEAVDPADILFHTGYCEWKGHFARKIIFCEGAAASKNSFFHKLPFTKNKGEALVLRIPGLSQDYIYQLQSRLVPMGGDLFWYGTNHVWDYEHPVPDSGWRKQQKEILSGWLNISFTVEQHFFAERPTTAGQFPIIGLHPHHPSIGIMNGLGSRGFTLAPYYAGAFADYLCGRNGEIAGYDTARMEQLWKKTLS